MVTGKGIKLRETFEGNLVSISQINGYSNLCNNSYSDHSALELKIIPKRARGSDKKLKFDQPLSLILERQGHYFKLNSGYTEISVEEEISVQSLYRNFMKNSEEAVSKDEDMWGMKGDVNRIVHTISRTLEEYGQNKALEILNDNFLTTLELASKKLNLYCTTGDENIEFIIAQGDHPNPRLKVNFELEEGKPRKAEIGFCIVGVNWFENMYKLLEGVFQGDYVVVKGYESQESLCKQGIDIEVKDMTMETCRRVDESRGEKEKKAPNPLCRAMLESKHRVLGYLFMVNEIHQANDSIGISFSSAKGDMSLLLQKSGSEFKVTYACFENPISENEVKRGISFVNEKMDDIFKTKAVAVKAVSKENLDPKELLSLYNVPLEGISINAFAFQFDTILFNDYVKNLEKMVVRGLRVASDDYIEKARENILNSTYANIVRTYQYTMKSMKAGKEKLRRKIRKKKYEEVPTINIFLEAFTKLVIFDEYKRREDKAENYGVSTLI